MYLLKYTAWQMLFTFGLLLTVFQIKYEKALTMLVCFLFLGAGERAGKEKLWI